MHYFIRLYMRNLYFMLYYFERKKKRRSVFVSALNPQQTCLKLGTFVGLISTTLS